MEIIDRHPFIDESLDAWTAQLGGAREAYRGHAYRVFNATRRILGRENADDVLAVASAHHDLGIWSDRTFDYLGPSVARAASWCHAHAPELDGALIARAIEYHHALFPYRTAPSADVVEAFRRGDLVDVSAGLLRAGLDRSFIGELRARWPYAGFHGVILRTAMSWMLRHPLRPLPMLR